MKPITTWILFADQGSSKVMESSSKDSRLRKVPGMEMKGPEKRKFNKDKGRSFNSVGAGRHTHEAHHHEETAFAESISSMLEDAKSGQRFDRLILCASPEMLGNLRKSLSPMVEKAVYGELAKDLVNIPDAELEKHFDSMLLN